jgi:hypothetical protein
LYSTKYYWRDQIKEIKMGGACSIGEINTLVRKSEDKRSLRRPRSKWEEKIKMDLKERVCEDVDLI